MKQFLYLIRGGDQEFNKLSPEEFQAHMEKWGAWMSDIKAEGFPLEHMLQKWPRAVLYMKWAARLRYVQLAQCQDNLTKLEKARLNFSRAFLFYTVCQIR